MLQLTYREAIRRALAEELERDEKVCLIGEDVAAGGGVFKVTDGLMNHFGSRRVRDTPISEQAIVGCALGAAVTGLRPVAEIMFADFAGVCFDQIANQAAKYSYMTGGQGHAPLTIRMAGGSGVGFAAQHSQAVENWFLNVPGLKLCVPSTPADAYGLLKAAIRDDGPVLYFEHKALYNERGPVPEEEEVTPLGAAEVVRPGNDVTVVANQLMRKRAEAAAEELSSQGISIELIDPCTVAPLDSATIVQSVNRTNHLVCMQEAPPVGGWSSAVIADVVRGAFYDLDAAPVLISGDPTPIPYAGALEEAWLPSTEHLVKAVEKLCGKE